MLCHRLKENQSITFSSTLMFKKIQSALIGLVVKVNSDTEDLHSGCLMGKAVLFLMPRIGSSINMPLVKYPMDYNYIILAETDCVSIRPT